MENFGELHAKYLELEREIDDLNAKIIEKEKELDKIKKERDKMDELYMHTKKVVCAWIECNNKLNK